MKKDVRNVYKVDLAIHPKVEPSCKTVFCEKCQYSNQKEYEDSNLNGSRSMIGMKTAKKRLLPHKQRGLNRND